MDPSERDVLIDLIGFVRTLANQTLALHLQLGAVRALLVAKGILTEAELRAAQIELSAATSIDEITRPDAPSPDEVFEDLVRRLQEPS